MKEIKLEERRIGFNFKLEFGNNGEEKGRRKKKTIGRGGEQEDNEGLGFKKQKREDMVGSVGIRLDGAGIRDKRDRGREQDEGKILHISFKDRKET